MSVIDHILGIIQSGGCVVMGVGVTPERYRLLLQEAASQDHVVIGAKNSKDAGLIASGMKGELIGPRTLSIAGLEMNAYLIRSKEAQ